MGGGADRQQRTRRGQFTFFAPRPRPAPADPPNARPDSAPETRRDDLPAPAPADVAAGADAARTRRPTPRRSDRPSPPPAPAPISPAAPDDDGSGPGPLAGRRVLLAEDTDDSRRLLTFFLNRAGAEVVGGRPTAARRSTSLDGSGRGGRRPSPAGAGRRRFDVVLMDMQMPVLDGYTAARELRARGLRRADHRPHRPRDGRRRRSLPRRRLRRLRDQTDRPGGTGPSRILAAIDRTGPAPAPGARSTNRLPPTGAVAD